MMKQASLSTLCIASVLTFASIALTACGANNDSPDSTQQVSAVQDGTPGTGNSNSAVEPILPVGSTDAVASSAVASVQASLAEDSSQVKPLMHSAPESN
jgi:hypothetical protein